MNTLLLLLLLSPQRDSIVEAVIEEGRKNSQVRRADMRRRPRK